MLARDQNSPAHLRALHHLQHRFRQSLSPLLHFNDKPAFGKCCQNVDKPGDAQSGAAKRELVPVDGKVIPRVGDGDFGKSHFADYSLVTGDPLEILIMDDDDLAVACHMHVQFDIRHAKVAGGLERRHRIFRVMATRTAMRNRPRTHRVKEFRINFGPHRTSSPTLILAPEGMMRCLLVRQRWGGRKFAVRTAELGYYAERSGYG